MHGPPNALYSSPVNRGGASAEKTVIHALRLWANAVISSCPPHSAECSTVSQYAPMSEMPSAAKKGMKVTLVEMSERILQRVAAPETSAFFRDLHTAHGVDLREGVGLKTLTGDTHVSGAELSDGSTLDVDFVIVGVGIRPDTALAEAAGLDYEALLDRIVKNGLRRARG